MYLRFVCYKFTACDMCECAVCAVYYEEHSRIAVRTFSANEYFPHLPNSVHVGNGGEGGRTDGRVERRRVMTNCKRRASE